MVVLQRALVRLRAESRPLGGCRLTPGIRPYARCHATSTGHTCGPLHSAPHVVYRAVPAFRLAAVD